MHICLPTPFYEKRFVGSQKQQNQIFYNTYVCMYLHTKAYVYVFTHTYVHMYFIP